MVRARDVLGIFAAAIFVALCALPLAPTLRNISLMSFQFNAWTLRVFPPEATVSGDPFYWQYILTYRSVCRVFIVYDGKDLETSYVQCDTRDITHAVNITDLLIQDNLNATYSTDWSYAKTLTQVQVQKQTALYLVGFAQGVVGIMVMLARTFTKWNAPIVEAPFKLGSVAFLIAAVSLVQVDGNPSTSFLAINWMAIIFMCFMLSISLVDLWYNFRHDTQSSVDGRPH